MRVIYEPVEGVDYLELILTPDEFKKAETQGCGLEFPVDNSGTPFVLNVFIRKEIDKKILEEEEEENAIKKRKKQGDHFEEYQRNGRKWTPSEASYRRGFNNGSQIGSKIS